MTFLILAQDTKRIDYQSNVRTAEDKKSENKRLKSVKEEPEEPNLVYIKSKTDQEISQNSGPKSLPVFNPSELLGRNYLDLPSEDGQKSKLKMDKI